VGQVAQHGAAGATHGQKLSEIEAAGERFSPEEQAKYRERQAKREKAAERRDDLRGEAKRAIDRSASSQPSFSAPAGTGAQPTTERRPLPSRPPRSRDVAKELVKVHGKQRGERSWKLFRRAAREFDEDQFQDGCRTIKPLVESNPEIAEMRELYGVALYRLGKWELAVEQLEAFRVLSGTTEQNPVLMDAHRALGNWSDVDQLWRELAEASPSGELIAEGRIIRAGAEADRGEIDGAIRVLEKGWKVPREPREHHLRRAYVLADLFEQSFQRVADFSSGLPNTSPTSATSTTASAACDRHRIRHGALSFDQFDLWLSLSTEGHHDKHSGRARGQRCRQDRDQVRRGFR